MGVRGHVADPVTYAKVSDFSLRIDSYVLLQLEKSQETVSVRYEDDRVMELALADVSRNQSPS